MLRLIATALAVTLAASASVVLARPGENAFVSDAEPDAPASVRDATPWQEGETRLPPWPRDADLVEFTLDQPRSGLRFLLDARHLMIGEDGIVRYTLVIEGRSGARNLSVEGLRCTPSGVYKVYAYGQNGHFIPMDDPQWQPISRHLDQDSHHIELWRYYLCSPRDFRPRPRAEIVRALSGAGNASQPSGLFAD